MTHCGKPTTKPAGKRMGTGHECLKKGIFIGKGLGEEESKEKVKKAKKKGIKKGKKLTKRKLLLGHQMTALEVRSLSKDMVRDILLRRNRRGLSSVGGLSRMSRGALQTSLITELTNTGKLKN